MRKTSPASEHTSATTNQSRRPPASWAGVMNSAVEISATKVAGLQRYSSRTLLDPRPPQPPTANTAATASETMAAVVMVGGLGRVRGSRLGRPADGTELLGHGRHGRFLPLPHFGDLRPEAVAQQTLVRPQSVDIVDGEGGGRRQRL